MNKELEERIERLEKKLEDYKIITNYSTSRIEDTLFFIERRCLALFDYVCYKEPEFKKIYSDIIRGKDEE